MAHFDRILLPTGFSTLSRRASEWVLPIAEKFGSEVHLVYVVPSPATIIADAAPVVGGGMAVEMPGPSFDEMLADARQQLDEFADETLGVIRARVRVHAAVGSVVDELSRYAETNHIDLVIMGTHADGVLKRLVFGSIGKRMIELAPCPVLLVPVKGVSRL